MALNVKPPDFAIDVAHVLAEYSHDSRLQFCGQSYKIIIVCKNVELVLNSSLAC